MEQLSGLYRSPLVRKEQKCEIGRTLNPTVTGTSVIGLVFEGGAIVAADTLGSYGSLARFRSLERIKGVNDRILVAVGGDYADYQNLAEELEDLVISNECTNTQILTAQSIFSWISTILYYQRSRFNPLMLNVLIAGFDEDQKPFIGSVNDRGTAYREKVIARGLGAYLVMPWLRQKLSGDSLPSREEAIALVKRAMTLLFYRDCKSFARFQYGIVCEGQKIEINDEVVESNWEMLNYEKLPVL